MSYVRKLIPLLRAIVAFAASILIGQSFIWFILPAMHLSLNNFRLIQDLPRLSQSALLAGLNIALALLLCRLVDRRPLSDFHWGLSWRAALLAVLGSALYVVAYMLLLPALQSRGMIRLYPVREIYPTYFALELVSFFFVGCWEEIFYRGYMFNTLRAYGRVPAYILSILLFSFGHFTQPGDPFSWLRLAGLVSATFTLTYVYDKTGSIWCAALIHGAYDFVTIFYIGSYPHFSLYTVLSQAGQSFNWNLPNIFFHLPILLLAVALYWGRRPVVTARASERVA